MYPTSQPSTMMRSVAKQPPECGTSVTMDSFGRANLFSVIVASNDPAAQPRPIRGASFHIWLAAAVGCSGGLGDGASTSVPPFEYSETHHATRDRHQHRYGRLAARWRCTERIGVVRHLGPDGIHERQDLERHRRQCNEPPNARHERRPKRCSPLGGGSMEGLGGWLR